jgi:transmembrane sensor
MERRLMTLGQELAACQDEFMRDRPNLPKGRARLLSSVSRQPRTKRLYRALAIAALLFGAAAVGFFLRGPLSTVPSGTVADAVKWGEWIAASNDASVPFQFADGTSLVLQPNGRARVTEVAHQRATVVVERGELRANVQPRTGIHWRVDVGPFCVTVVGTVFDASWQPELERFSLALRRGEVKVTGPVIGGERVVRAGERLDVWVSRGKLQSSRIDESSKSGVVDVDKAPASLASSTAASPRVSGDHRVPEEASAAIGSANPMEAFRGLARSDRYRDALAEAERIGFDSLCGSASSADVALLGDVARLAGSVGRAQQAYLALRQRFAGNPAAQAAFMLGRIAQDQQGAYVEAAAYFASYLREAQEGVFAREAASRLVESRMHAGDRDGAKSAAAQYLDAYPSGPYADKAREVLLGP